MAPDLVQIERHFKKDGVVFLGLSPDEQTAAKRFARRHDLTWVMGWGAQEVVERYLGRQYPTLLLIGRDGRVVWNDGGARLQHRDQDAAVALFEQIEKAL